MLRISSLLETAQYKRFWREVETSRHLIEPVSGFDDTVRSGEKTLFLFAFLSDTNLSDCGSHRLSGCEHLQGGADQQPDRLPASGSSFLWLFLWFLAESQSAICE